LAHICNKRLPIRIISPSYLALVAIAQPVVVVSSSYNIEDFGEAKPPGTPPLRTSCLEETYTRNKAPAECRRCFD